MLCHSINISFAYTERKSTWSKQAKANLWIQDDYSLSGFIYISLAIYWKIATKRNIISWNETDTINHLGEIGNMAANWISIQRAQKLNACDAKNHKSYSCFGSARMNDWRREADRNVLCKLSEFVALSLFCFFIIFNSHTRLLCVLFRMIFSLLCNWFITFAVFMPHTHTHAHTRSEEKWTIVIKCSPWCKTHFVIITEWIMVAQTREEN